MKVEFWLVGKTKEAWISEAIGHYQKRCSRYCTISADTIAESRFAKADDIRRDETARIMLRLNKSQNAYTILLDEAGAQVSSVQFAELISRQQSAGQSTLRFLIGGAYGVDPALHQEVNYIMALSPMTFPHQLVRIIFLEQLYRAFTILRGEGYHHV